MGPIHRPMPTDTSIAASILVVDPDQGQLGLAEAALSSLGCGTVTSATSLETLTQRLDQQRWVLVVLAIHHGESDCAQQLRTIINAHPGVSVLATGADDARKAITCLRAGACDYLVRPLTGPSLIEAARRVLDQARLRHQDLSDADAKHELPGLSRSAQRSLEQAFPHLAPSRKPLLIVGEAGTGKRRLARALHLRCARPGPFAPIYAASLDPQRLKLCISQLAGGTLFIDEIALVSQQTQEVLVRSLIEQEEEDAAGGAADRVHLIFGNSPFRSLLSCNQRLLLQLRGRHIILPPLRECRDELPVLVAHLVETLARDLKRERPAVPATLFRLLQGYTFPGNIRELRALIGAAVRGTSGKTLSLTPFQEALARVEAPSQVHQQNAAKSLLGQLDHLPSLRDIQGLLIEEALRRTRNHQAQAATMLGISRQALHKRLRGRPGSLDI